MGYAANRLLSAVFGCPELRTNVKRYQVQEISTHTNTKMDASTFHRIQLVIRVIGTWIDSGFQTNPGADRS